MLLHTKMTPPLKVDSAIHKAALPRGLTIHKNIFQLCRFEDLLWLHPPVFECAHFWSYIVKIYIAYKYVFKLDPLPVPCNWKIDRNMAELWRQQSGMSFINLRMHWTGTFTGWTLDPFEYRSCQCRTWYLIGSYLLGCARLILADEGWGKQGGGGG